MARSGGGNRTSLDLYRGTSSVAWSDAYRARAGSISGAGKGGGRALRVPAAVAGRYTIGEKLGAGNFGVVHRATDRVTGAAVAVKLLDPATGAARVRREVVALRGLRLPGVVRLLDEGMEGEWPFLVMALVEGTAFPGVRAPAPWAAIEDATASLLEVLGRVHEAGALHLDIKPANVRVTPAGAVVLLDLGLAHGPALGGAAGVLGGTERYMAPELASARTASARSDLYSVGMMLWEALAGAPPASQGAVARARPGDAPGAVWALIRTLLDRDPDRRPASAWAALDRLLAGGGRRRAGWALPLPPGPDILTEEALCACFHGPERVLHVPSDAAARLRQRTGGRRDRVEAELRRWIRLGLAVPEGGRLRMQRAAIDQLDSAAAAEQIGRADTAAPMQQSEAPAHARDRDAHLAARELVLARLIASGQSDEAVGAALDVARARLLQGRFDRTRVALEQALLLIRRGDVTAGAGTAMEPALLALWARMAFELRSPAELEMALYEVERAVHRSTASDAMAVLLRAALLAEGGHTERAWAQLDGLTERADQPPGATPGAIPGVMEDPSLALLWHWLRLRLATRQGASETAATLADIEEALAPVREMDEVAARVLGWQGQLRYQQRAFAQAAALQEQAAQRARACTQRLGFLLNSASAWMEMGCYDRAEALADQVLAQARAARYPLYEGHAEWLLRAVAYRAGRATAPDHALVEASVHIGVPYIEGLICLNEAAVTWRRAGLHEAEALAARAHRRFAAADLHAGRMLAQALMLACQAEQGGLQAPSAALAALAREALAASILDVDWQVLGMLASMPGGARWQADAERLASAAPRSTLRRELLAPHEVLDVR